MHNQVIEQQSSTSILERPDDPTLYRVWIGFSTELKLWKDMSTVERLMQIEAEHVAFNRIY